MRSASWGANFLLCRPRHLPILRSLNSSRQITTDRGFDTNFTCGFDGLRVRVGQIESRPHVSLVANRRHYIVRLVSFTGKSGCLMEKNDSILFAAGLSRGVLRSLKPSKGSLRVCARARRAFTVYRNEIPSPSFSALISPKCPPTAYQGNGFAV